MQGSNFLDEVDCGNFLDHIDDLLDFPADDSDAAAGNFDLPENLFPVDSDSQPSPESVLTDSGNASPDITAELSVPFEDIVQLEWLSNFVEDSFSGGSLTMKKVEPCCGPKEDLAHTEFQTARPLSVIETRNSSSGEKTAPHIYIPVPCGRARSKRRRPLTFNPHHVLQLISPDSSVGENMQPNVTSKASFCSEKKDFGESQTVIKVQRQAASGEHKKKKKIKLSLALGQADGNHNSSSQTVRKCMHCEITKTPQWRAGPMGPKTLCNACGVRFKKGRLFPEYRPAASPTFCPSLHSNSHKKVLEMRNNTSQKSGFAMDSDALPELIPNTNSSLTLEYM
ncbi:putative transcription factor C2C2-GATA family [Lupinus albus]|uniref:GATA transcription factor n=1 Tax=Lupinus albus TaxID=3870 RepID=A0A6A4NYP3_LUPAL|nr:putative transcription factor C2C2-GATA family [Lupinus albus]